MNNPFGMSDLEYQRRKKEGEKAVLKIFTNRIKESFLRDTIRRFYETYPNVFEFFDIRYDYVQNFTGTSDMNFSYEIMRNIVSVHRFNTVGKTVQERVAMEQSNKYKQELCAQVYEQIRLRDHTSTYFRKRQFIQGDEFIYFPVPYKLFAICIEGLTILQTYESPYRQILINIFNKSLAALALLEDNLMDSVYPICRGVIELYIKYLTLLDFPEVLEYHNTFVRLELEKTVSSEMPEEFKDLYKQRLNQHQRDKIAFLHYGWVDKIDGYHQIENHNPYSFNSLLDYTRYRAEDADKDETYEILLILYNRCHAFTHGNMGNSGYPLLHCMELSMILYMVLLHTYQILCDEVGRDTFINGIDIVQSITNDGNKMMDQYAERSTEMFETFYKPKG